MKRVLCFIDNKAHETEPLIINLIKIIKNMISFNRFIAMVQNESDLQQIEYHDEMNPIHDKVNPFNVLQ